jgi:hypothetical protein
VSKTLDYFSHSYLNHHSHPLDADAATSHHLCLSLPTTWGWCQPSLAHGVAASHPNGWPRVLAKKERGREIWSRETEGEIQATGGGVPTERERDRGRDPGHWVGVPAEREREERFRALGVEFRLREKEEGI